MQNITLALNGRVDNYCYTQCVAIMYLSLLSSSVRSQDIVFGVVRGPGTDCGQLLFTRRLHSLHRHTVHVEMVVKWHLCSLPVYILAIKIL